LIAYWTGIQVSLEELLELFIWLPKAVPKAGTDANEMNLPVTNRENRRTLKCKLKTIKGC
jgi:hypothetical protein